MTLCDAKLAEEILDEYIATINDFLYENGHYQQKRTISLNKWGTYSFDKKISVQIANEKSKKIMQLFVFMNVMDLKKSGSNIFF